MSEFEETPGMLVEFDDRQYEHGNSFLIGSFSASLTATISVQSIFGEAFGSRCFRTVIGDWFR